MFGRSEQGQSFVIWTLALVFVMLPVMAWTIDQGSLYWARRDRQKAVDAACLDGAIAGMRRQDVRAAVHNSLQIHGIPVSDYDPAVGSGDSLGKGIDISDDEIRVAVWGPTLSWFSQFIPGFDGWEIGARARCEMGIGTAMPLALKEYEGPPSDILYVKGGKKQREWASEVCPANTYEPYDPGPPASGVHPSDRVPQNCWVWGDWQILVGDGHLPNEGSISMRGALSLDVRCEGNPGPDNTCTDRYFVPPVAEDTNPNTLKNLTETYYADGGYTAALPVPGTYQGKDSALVAQHDGTPTSHIVQIVSDRYDVGDLLVGFVYKDGELHDGESSYDYVEIIGYAVFRMVYEDANTIAVVPFFPATNQSGFPQSIAELEDAGFVLKPILIPWAD